MSVRKVLDRARTEPKVSGEVHHDYDDKFCLAEGLVSVAAASWLGCLENLGLREAELRCLCETAQAGRHALTLRCAARETCTLKKKASREVPSDTKVVSSSSFLSRETKIVTTGERGACVDTDATRTHPSFPCPS